MGRSRVADSCKHIKVLWNSNIYYLVHKSPPLLYILSEINSVHAPHPVSLRFILMFYIHLRLCFPNVLFPSAFKKLHGLSPRANYTYRATAACRRSDCQLVRIEGATWSA
jgi:hypothetical protein